MFVLIFFIIIKHQFLPFNIDVFFLKKKNVIASPNINCFQKFVLSKQQQSLDEITSKKLIQLAGVNTNFTVLRMLMWSLRLIYHLVSSEGTAYPDKIWCCIYSPPYCHHCFSLMTSFGSKASPRTGKYEILFFLLTWPGFSLGLAGFQVYPPSQVSKLLRNATLYLYLNIKCNLSEDKKINSNIKVISRTKLIKQKVLVIEELL